MLSVGGAIAWLPAAVACVTNGSPTGRLREPRRPILSWLPGFASIELIGGLARDCCFLILAKVEADTAAVPAS